ncbi:extensin [Streptomyces sp. NBC_00648]|uniref:extensin n=1 Tax=Streptomyces sp. NBC_00648 TaxID=2975797 RepID=UPI00324FB2C3
MRTTSMPTVQRLPGRRTGRSIGALAASVASSVASNLSHLGSTSTSHAPPADPPPSYSPTPDDSPPPYTPGSSVTSSAADPPPAYTAVPAGGFDPRELTDFQLDELVHRIIGRITRLIRTELRLDRERIGRLRDPRP